MSDFSSPSSEPGSKTPRSMSPGTVRRVLGTLASLGLLIYLLAQQGWQEIISAIQQIPTWRLALALALMMVSRFAVAARWHVLLRSAGVPTSYKQTLRITFAGLFASNFLPTTIGGDVVRLAGAIQQKFDAAVCTASLIADRLIGMAGMAMTVPFSIPSLTQYLNTQIGWNRPFFLASFSRPGFSKWQQKGLSILKRIFGALQTWLKQPRAMILALIWSWVHMLCLFSILQLLLDGLNTHLSFWLIAGLYSLVYFVTLIPISINGYGLQELSLTLIFSTLGKAPLNSGLTTALLFRTIMVIASIPGVLFVPGMLSAAANLKGKG